jgi:hypothetical protein
MTHFVVREIARADNDVVLGLDQNDLRPILERLHVINVRRAEDLPRA